MMKLKEGAKAPKFSLKSKDGKKVSLSDYKGDKVVVYFYPKDDTPGCTKEACQFQENLTVFNKSGVKVVGISPDENHDNFINKYGLQFPLLSDVDHSVMQSYGAYGEKTMYGKKVIGVIRSTFLIDEDGIILKAWYNVKADGHATKVLELAKSL